MAVSGPRRREWLLRGVVQGVGFRPHVARIAARHEVTGFVGNDELQVFVELQGEPEVLDRFQQQVLDELPALAHVVGQHSRELPVVTGEQGFRIVVSRHLAGRRSLVPPDVATCEDCLQELRDPADRRYRHPFITCTNCGPRLSIVRDLPYDRPQTTMSDFPMCARCAAEYVDVDDRRFHAQPISCWDCGPALWLVPSGAREVGAPDRGREAQLAVIEQARALLLEGGILAVKGIGGFHLMCDARNPAAVERLRERKRKSGKPFAVMVADLDAARELVELDEQEVALLTSAARPVVIAPMTAGHGLAEAVAPGLADLGLLLPYAPLHHLLLETDGSAPSLALVATSGNAASEPLCHENEDAVVRLARLADAFLFHDRPIHVPVEDSVFLGPVPSRRSRGHAPLPVVLPGRTAEGPCVLGVGGEYKNTFTLATGDLAFVSAHIGDMGSWESQRAYQSSVDQLVDIQRQAPEVLVHDLHPDYATTAWAQRRSADDPLLHVLAVQHHWAHALALLAEHGIDRGPVVVATLDGTGYGTDGTIWGGEVLTLGEDLLDWSRTWHVPNFGLVGGDRAIRHPWRIALGLGHDWGLDIASSPSTMEAPADELRLVRSQLATGFGVVRTSSLGRLFDAVSSLLGVCQHATYEAQAAMELERIARLAPTGDCRPESLPDLVEELLTSHLPLEERARRFHDGAAWAVAHQMLLAAERAGTRTVGITGGVAMNRLFLAALRARLQEEGLTVLTHRVVPPNDGGLSLGQAVAGRLLVHRGSTDS